MALLEGSPEESNAAIIGGIIYMILVWFVFWEVIQPAFANLSPIFINNPNVDGTLTPDGPVEILLIITVLIGLFSYYELVILLYEDPPTSSDSTENDTQDSEV